MAMLTAQIQCDEITDSGSDEAHGYSHDGDCTVRISNDAAENGYDQDPGPLAWMNSARIVTDPKKDSVTFLVSIDDPRGALAFTVRRLDDGRLMIHVPYPEAGLQHVHVKHYHPGTMVVVDERGRDRDFSDPEPEWMEAIREMGRAELLRLLADEYDAEDEEEDEELRRHAIRLVQEGTIDRDQISS